MAKLNKCRYSSVIRNCIKKSIHIYGYNACRADWDKNCGGVAVYVKYCFPTDVILSKSVSKELELLAIDVEISENQRIMVVGCLHTLQCNRIKKTISHTNWLKKAMVSSGKKKKQHCIMFTCVHIHTLKTHTCIPNAFPLFSAAATALKNKCTWGFLQHNKGITLLEFEISTIPQLNPLKEIHLLFTCFFAFGNTYLHPSLNSYLFSNTEKLM